MYRTTDATPTVLKRYGYAYDTAGNRTMARVDDAPTTFTYNQLNQLTSQAGGGAVQFSGTTSEPATVTIAGAPATGAGSTAFGGSATLPAGTSTVAITARDASGNAVTQSYEVDVPVSASSSTYDANGNLITKGTRTYEWDAANQLVRVLDTGTEIARFVYDGYGRRVQKTTSGTTRSYVYSGINILEERSSAGTIRIVQGPGIDRPLASVDGAGTVAYYLADHLGSIVQQTDASATVTTTRRYDPYGAPLQGASTSGFAYTGREWDAEIGLYFFRARYYDPGIGRFLNKDPAGLSGGDLNLYNYVGNAPIGRLDPSGMDAISAATKFGWGLVVGAAAAVVYAGAAAISATGAAVVAVGIGSYQATIAFQEVVLGFDPYTGRSLSTDARVDTAAGIAGGIVGGGLVSRGLASSCETAQLKGHLDNAIAKFNREGFTDAQAEALVTNPKLEAGFRGDRIDAFFKKSVGQDPALQHLELTPRFKFGPDVFNPANQRWWDVTTPGQWNAHMEKYWLFGNGTPLFTK